MLDAETWEEKAVIPLDIGRRFFRVKGEHEPLPTFGEVRVGVGSASARCVVWSHCFGGWKCAVCAVERPTEVRQFQLGKKGKSCTCLCFCVVNRVPSMLVCTLSTFIDLRGPTKGLVRGAEKGAEFCFCKRRFCRVVRR